MVKTIMILIYLFFLSIWDIRDKKVPLWMIGIGLSAAFLSMAAGAMPQDESAGIVFCERWKALLPGLGMLLIAIGSKKAGVADGLLLLFLGLLYDARRVVLGSCIGLWIMALFCAVLLGLRKVQKNTKMPYIPFLTLGHALGLWLMPE